jgi:hypothetical protein
VPTPVRAIERTMCQHDFEGRRIFQHRNLDKWKLSLRNRRITDFWFEPECRDDVILLRQLWDGQINSRDHSERRPPTPIVPLSPSPIVAATRTIGVDHAGRKTARGTVCKMDFRTRQSRTAEPVP